VDSWAPIFFLALIFALAMDHAVFLLSSVRDALERPAIPAPGSSRALPAPERSMPPEQAVLVVGARAPC
jgi:RND superfamily putative drug exporter